MAIRKYSSTSSSIDNNTTFHLVYDLKRIQYDHMISFAFGGGGFSMPYGLGFSKRIRLAQKTNKYHQFKNLKVSGASSGALVAASHLLDPDKVFNILIDGSKDVGSAQIQEVPNVVEGIVRNSIDKFMHDTDIDSLNDHLFVSISLLNGLSIKNKLVSEYESFDDLKEALYASCFIPYYTGPSAYTYYRGSKAVDGGFTNNAPILKDTTYVVSPIKAMPIHFLPFEYDFVHADSYYKVAKLVSTILIPNDVDTLNTLYKSGYDAGDKFITMLENGTLPPPDNKKFRVISQV